MTVKFDESIRCWLPFPPSVNTLFPTNHTTGKRYPSRKYTAWKKEAWVLLKQARVPLIQSRVDIEIELTAGDRRTRDADNYSKAVIDALVEAGVLPDDNSKHVRSVKPCWCDHDKDEAGALVIITKIAA